MKSRAIVIGIDAYATRPLTSAANDARAFRDLLVNLKLVPANDIVFLEDDDATRDAIGTALRDIYDFGATLDRFYFYFSGHGLSAPKDAARASFGTAIIPVDVTDLASDGHKLINVDEFGERLRVAGPREQMFFLDACRDDPFDSNPGNLPPLTWPASQNPSDGPNAQGILYAVSLGGQALGARDGLGVMTSYLLAALAGEGTGADFSEEYGSYVVTMESLRNCVLAKVKDAVRGKTFWERQYMLPQLITADPRLSPLRMIASLPSRPLVITIEPPTAIGETNVLLTQQRHELMQPRWPPSESGVAVEVEPQRYRIVASSTLGDAFAEPELIDVRQESSVVVHVSTDLGAAAESAAGPTSGPSAAQLYRGAVSEPPEGGVANVEARFFASAFEAQTTIDLEALDPPYASWSALGNLEQVITPGFYCVRFRLGVEVFSAAEFAVGPGDNVVASPLTAPSQVVQQMLGLTTPTDSVVISGINESLQSAVLPTLLPILGVKPFDETGEFFARFSGFVPALDAATFEQRPFALVLALDGHEWPRPVEDVLSDASCSLEMYSQTPDSVAAVPLAPFGEVDGQRRVATGYATAPGSSFRVRVRSQFFGQIEVAAAAITGRVTVLTVTLRVNGDVSVSQNLLRIPGRPYAEPEPHLPYGRLLRELQLGQQLFGSGELVTIGESAGGSALSELLYAKWSDPILGAMAYYAWSDAVRLGVRTAEPWLTDVADNLLRYFPELTDSHVVAGIARPSAMAETYMRLLDSDAVPVLARSSRALAWFATQNGSDDAAVVQAASRLSPDAIWNASWDLPAYALVESAIAKLNV